MPTGPRIAIVHDYFTQQGGAERVVDELVRLFPDAPVHASVFDPEVLPDRVRATGVKASRLQPLRTAGLPLPLLAPVLPTAFGSLRFDGARAVISSTSAFAHHIRPPAGAVHLAYCHSPPHFLYQPDDYFRDRSWQRALMAPALAILRRADQAAGHRVDVYIANSRYSADRIQRCYGRTATVIHPPIDSAAFSPVAERSGRFLVVARLRRHKRLELALQAANHAGLPLDVIGDGPDARYLRTHAGDAVRFLGRLSDDEVRAAMARCDGLIVPGIEDFGLTIAEVQAAGRPPIAFAAGGALEIVRDGVTGFLFAEPTVDAIVDAMRRARDNPLEPATLVESARRFDRPRFDADLGALVARAIADPDAVRET
jgi:glycosyltransferase involved in cell wall biosynthesis